MTFFESNKHFIQQVFFIGMKNLSQQERISRYNTFRYSKLIVKEEVRERIFNYYKENEKNNIENIYAELFELLSEYESDYLLLNLLYEQESVKIVNHLLNNNRLNNLLFKGKYKIAENYFANIILNHRSNKIYTTLNYKNFINSYISNTLNIDNIINTDHFLLIKLYSHWLIKNISINIYECKRSFFYFIALWPFLNSWSINEKSIYFYHCLITDLNNNSSEGLHEFLSYYENCFRDLFVSITHVPLINKNSSVVFTKGYLIKRKSFEAFIEISKKIDQVNYSSKISDLLNIMNNLKDSNLLLKNIEVFNNKTINKIVSKENILEIATLELNEKTNLIRLNLLKKQYRFEYFNIFNDCNTSFKKNDFKSNPKIDNLKNIDTKKNTTDYLKPILKNQRYSDSDLKIFKSIINKKISTIQSDLNFIKYTNSTNQISDNIILYSRIKNLNMWLEKYHDALKRIEDKTFGICFVSGQLINKKRLIALPHITISLDAKNIIKK
jgi:DnaK suppressor protein